MMPSAVQVSRPRNSLSGFGSAGESEDDCAKDLDTIVVGSVHAHCNWNQIILAKAKASDHFYAG